mmetsp:Transcript_8313/g.28298  ORF Transcript_8313/g.28298 Transcript_8313/m.28298 type:complete len:99 (+) Transcript_8313:19-315(+)
MASGPKRRPPGPSFLRHGLPFLAFMGLGSLWLGEIVRGKQSLRDQATTLRDKETIKRARPTVEEELAILQGKIDIHSWENRALPDFPGARNPNRKPAD